MANYKLDGFGELERSFVKLGKVPQAAANASARAGATIVRRAAKVNAPEDTGALKNEGIIMRKERKKVAGKAVYDILIDPAMNAVFVKISKSGKRSYYPASQEYGYLTKNGGYVPGLRYMRRAADDNEAAVERKMLETSHKYVDKALAKGR